MAARRNAVSRKNDDDIRGKLETLKSDLSALQNDLKGLAGDAGQAAAARMNQTLTSAIDTATLTAGRVEELGADYLASFEANIRQRPVTSFAIAVGIGALLGSVLFRR